MQKKEIKKWLIDKDLTMQTIADEAQVDLSLVSRIFKGERGQQRGPKTKRVLRVLRRLGCPAEFLENSGQGSVASGQ